MLSLPSWTETVGNIHICGRISWYLKAHEFRPHMPNVTVATLVSAFHLGKFTGATCRGKRMTIFRNENLNISLPYQSVIPDRPCVCVVGPATQPFPLTYQACEQSHLGPSREAQPSAEYHWITSVDVTWNRRQKLPSSALPKFLTHKMWDTIKWLC